MLNNIFDYNNLKQSYITAIQLALSCNMQHDEIRGGNNILHDFCNVLVETSEYSEADKKYMKSEFDRIKEQMSVEIDCYYRKIQ